MMVSTEKRYPGNNFPPLYDAVRRGDTLYQIRVYRDRAVFQSSRAGLVRMRVLLACIEARAVVIDAIIKDDGALQYLSVICASPARPEVLSPILRKVVPGSIVEEIDRTNAEERVSVYSVRESPSDIIPFSREIGSVHASRDLLHTLLLEHRALLAEYRSVVRDEPAFAASRPAGRPVACLAQLLFFQREDTVCAIPAFQVEKVASGANGASLIHVRHEYGQRVIVASDLLFLKDVNLQDCELFSRESTGFYRARVAQSGLDGFCLVVPSFL